jgi:predicted transcriptional regulator
VTPAVDPAVAAQSISIADLKTAGLPETYFGQDGKLNTKDLTTHLGEFASLKAANDERAKGVPTDGKYDFALPKDWKAPEGLDATGFEWGMSDGRKAAIADIAKSLNLSQSEVTAAMAKLAAADLGEKISTSKASQESAKAAEDAIKADAVKVLGANYTEVCANLRQAMVPIFGQELATNIGFQKAADVKAMLEFVESYKTKLAANPTPAGGQPGDPLNKLYPTMNPAR